MSGARQKILIAMFLLGFAAIVLASVAQRVANPSLTEVNSPPPEMPAPSAIGQLMNEAARNPDNPEVLLNVAEGLLARGQNEAAAEFARRALAAEAKNARALHLLGVISHQKGEHKQAAEWLERSAAIEDSAGARYSLGVLYLHFLGDSARAEDNLQKALAFPGAPPALKAAAEEELAKARTAKHAGKGAPGPGKVEKRDEQ